MSRSAWRIALLVGLVLLTLAPAIAPGRTFVFRDALPFAAAQNHVHQAAVRRGALPEWDDSQYAGVPFLAAPLTQSLYPPRLAATFLASPTSATELLVVFHLLLALVGAWKLGRELGLGRVARTALAITYVLSGPVLSVSENLPSLAGACWLPLSLSWLLAARRAEGDAAGSWLLAAAGLALPFYGGATQAVAWLLVAGTLIALWPDGRSRRARVGALTLLLGCAAALGAALILPAAWVYPETTRGQLSLVEVGTWSFHPARVLELGIPFPLGLPFGDRANYLGSALEPRARELWSHTVFLGAAPLLLAVCALGRLPRRLRIARVATLAAGLIGLLLACGRHTPLLELLSHTPYRVFRYPEKHLLLVALAGACLAGIGTQALLSARPWREPRRLLPLLLVPTGVLVATPLSGAWSTSLALSIGRGAPSIAPQAAAVIAVQLALIGLLALPGLARRRRTAAILLLIGVSGVACARQLVVGGDAKLATTPPPAVAWLRANVPALQEPLPPRVVRYPPGPFGRPPAGLSPSEARAAMMLMSLQGASARLYGLDGLHGMTGFRPKRLDALLRRGGAAGLSRGAAPFVIGPSQHHQAPSLTESLGVGLFRLPAQPRVTLPGGSIQRIERPRPEQITLEVEAPQAATLVVRDAWFPGWTATVDGKPVGIELADEAFLGIPLPAGAKRVTLRYRTPGLTPGLLLALPAWLLLLLGAGRRQLRRPR